MEATGVNRPQQFVMSIKQLTFLGNFNSAQDLGTHTKTGACSGPSLSLSSGVIWLRELMDRPWRNKRR